MTRLRQIALVAYRLAPVTGQLERGLGVHNAFHDPGVGEFGLENAVYAVGADFVEVVAPVAPVTAAERYLDRRGGDAGYMALFQVPDMEAARARLARLGIRAVWQVDFPDMAGTHLHPKQAPGAIVSLDWAEPAESWRWGGPDWAARATTTPSGLAGLTVATLDPASAARAWAAVLDVPVGGTSLSLDGGAQRIDFVRAEHERDEGISEVALAGWDHEPVTVAGVAFRRGAG
ncbi:MAG TPA: hypothetical protein VFA94_06605 [Acidimicrobiales bacterium]|nr:hypothetical protein [Acidimicrobiales bacterium]